MIYDEYFSTPPGDISIFYCHCEDEEIIAADIGECLEEKGYRVPAILNSGEEAVDYIGHTPPDLVLMDIMLTGSINGIEATSRIQRQIDIPVVYLTAYANQPILDQAKLTNYYGYLLKPFQDKELHTTVKMALNKFERERNSHQWFISTFNTLKQGAIILDVNHRVVQMNSTAERLTGRSLKEVNTAEVSEVVHLFHQDKQVSLADMFEQLQRENQFSTSYTNYWILSKSKQFFPIEVSLQFIYTPQGQHQGYTMILEDLTEQKQIEATYLKPDQVIRYVEDFTDKRQIQFDLEKLKGHLDSKVVEQTADNVILTNQLGVIQYVNPAFEKCTGYTSEEVVGRTPRFLKSNRHDQRFYSHMWKTILSGNAFRATLINRKKDGQLFYEDKTITPLRSKSGEITHFVSTGKEITQLVEANLKLEESEILYRNLMDQFPEAIFIHHNEPIYANQKGLHLLGFDHLRQWPSGHSLDDFLVKPVVAPTLASLRETTSPLVMSNQLRQKDGSLIEVEVTLSPVDFLHRPCLQITIRDITKTLQEQKLTRKLDYFSNLEELSTVMVHEIRTPLEAVQLYQHYLQRSLELTPEQQEITDGISQGIKCIEAILENIHSFTSPHNPQLAPWDIHEILDDCLQFIQFETLSKDVAVVRKYQASHQTVMVDYHQMVQVFTNLFQNAVQSMETPGVLTVSTHENQYSLIIEITDNGPGIPPQSLDKIFSPFYTTKKGGTGVGLAVVNKILTEHMVDVTVKSPPQGGTTFSLEFPK